MTHTSKNDLDIYDNLECPHCQEVSKPYRINIKKTVTYQCPNFDCGEQFRINVDGDLIE